MIDAIELTDYRQDEITIRVVCSKGTYIRALARDIGRALGSGGYLTYLRRTRVGDAFMEKALSIAEALRLIHEAPMSVADDNGVITEVPADVFDADFMLRESADIKPFDER